MKPLPVSQTVRVLAVALLAAAGALIGCTIKQQVQIEADGSGTVDMSIHLQPLFVDYLGDLAELTGEPMADQVFNVEEIKKGFSKREDVELLRIATPGPESLEMKLRFRSIEQVFSGEQKLKQAGVIRFDTVPEGYSVRFHLDKSNFSSVLEFMPVLQNPLFEGLGPQENEDISEAEYYELIDLALGEGGAECLEASYIETRVTVKGTLVSQSGGSLSERGVTYRIPLIRVLLLDKPLDYSLIFK
jgi:hypothetical protein